MRLILCISMYRYARFLFSTLSHVGLRVCGLDAVNYRLLQRWRPLASR